MFEKFGLIKNVIGAVAPTLGTALGGPMGGMAANMISEVLGCGNEPKQIERALQQATPEQLTEIKKIEKVKIDTFDFRNKFFSARRALSLKHADYGRNISIIMLN